MILLDTLFTVHQVSKACGISRATILRLESKGLLTPAYVDGRTGFRYYDNHNVSRIMQIQLFLQMGLSYEDALRYYRANGTSRELLEDMEAKYLTLKRAYEEIKMRVGEQEEIIFEFLTLPEHVCYARGQQLRFPVSRASGGIGGAGPPILRVGFFGSCYYSRIIVPVVDAYVKCSFFCVKCSFGAFTSLAS